MIGSLLGNVASGAVSVLSRAVTPHSSSNSSKVLTNNQYNKTEPQVRYPQVRYAHQPANTSDPLIISPAILHEKKSHPPPPPPHCVQNCSSKCEISNDGKARPPTECETQCEQNCNSSPPPQNRFDLRNYTTRYNSGFQGPANQDG